MHAAQVAGFCSPFVSSEEGLDCFLAAAARRSFSSWAVVHCLHFSAEPVLRCRSSACVEEREYGVAND